MSLLSWSIIVVFVGCGVYLGGWGSSYPKPKIQDGWFGRGKRRQDDRSIREFKVNVSEEVLVDLNQRLQSTRFGEDLENNENQYYGVNVATMKQFTEYWKNTYDWRKHEAELNTLPQFVTQIEGIDVHFIRVKPARRSKSRPARILLMSHGWPGSVWEFYKILPLLTEPQKYGGQESDAFEVICPSIPGFGFSEAPHQKGFDVTSISRVYAKLMERLGHKKFYVQGGDWGGRISMIISLMYPSRVVGMHVNMYAAPLTPWVMFRQFIAGILPSLHFTPDEYKRFVPGDKQFIQMLREMGYFHLQATKPDTIGMGLNDSPVGLAAYILEKFSTATNETFIAMPDGGLMSQFTMDDLLTNIMIYWVTGTITSSARLYRESIAESVEDWMYDKIKVDTPAGLANFPSEPGYTPRYLAKLRFSNILQITELPSGGHFAAMEEPKLLADDFMTFARKIEEKAKQSRNKYDSDDDDDDDEGEDD